jgi:hypothetical protein
MNILSVEEIEAIVSKSRLVAKYNLVIDSESAYEMLNEKLDEAAEKSSAQPQQTASRKAEKSTLQQVLDNSVVRQVGRTAASIITRSLLGALGLGGRSRGRSSRKRY